VEGGHVSWADFMHCRNETDGSRMAVAKQVPILATAPKRKRGSHEREGKEGS